jgi:predicted lipid-binding transport protein (Tim44 family)
MNRINYRSLFACLAVFAALAYAVVEAEARSRGSFGSRGSRTFSAPPATQTSPRATRPIERTMTQPGQTGSSTVGRAATPAPQQGGLLNRPGLLGGLAAGFLGAGLIGMLMGHGFMGGLAGLASLFGLLLQVGIVAGVGFLLWRWWQGRSQQPALAGGPNLRQGLHGMDEQRVPDERRPMNIGALGRMGGLGGAAQQSGDSTIEIKPEDYDTFERLLGEVQTAYGAEDLNALRARVTPEMLSYYSDELAHNASQGDTNQISNVKLLQGDLSEAWSEGNDDYATVAMRYSVDDRIVDRSTGKLIEQLPDEVTELWTFRRARGGNWLVSAVQQTEED